MVNRTDRTQSRVPYAGVNRVRFEGCNLSPSATMHRDAPSNELLKCRQSLI